MEVNQKIADALPADIKSGGVTVAISTGAPPDSYAENGEVVGWQIDLMNAVGQVWGVKVTFQEGTFDTFIPGLQSGRYDLAAGSFSPNPERLEAIDLVTVGQAGTSFGYRTNGAKEVLQASDLCGQTAATLAGSTYPEQLAELGKDCPTDSPVEVQTYPSQPDAVLAVTSGRADLYVGTETRVAYFAGTTDGAMKQSKFVYMPRPMAEGLSKKSKLLQPLQLAVQDVIDSGVYEKIMAKWNVKNSMIKKAEILPESSRP